MKPSIVKPMSPLNLPRRTFLTFACLAAGGTAFGVQRLFARDADRQRLLQALGLSAQSLHAFASEPQVRRQLQTAAQHWPQLRTTLLAADGKTVRARFQRCVREDFAAGRLIDIDGWQLPASEAAVLALLADVV